MASTRDVGFNGKTTTGAGEYIAMLDVQQRTRDTATCGVESYMEKITGTEAVSTVHVINTVRCSIPHPTEMAIPYPYPIQSRPGVHPLASQCNIHLR